MARKKRRRAKRKGIFGRIASLFQFIGILIWKLLPTIIIASILIAGGLGIRKMLYRDTFLNIQDVSVIPVNAISQRRIQSLENKILGKNILKLDLKQISDELERNPEIQLARVIRDMPSKIVIEIKKREPIAFIRFKPRGSYGIVASDGYIIDVTRHLNSSLILIEDYSRKGQSLRIGSRVKNKGFSEAARFLKSFWEDEISRQITISRISLDNDGNVTVTLGVGPDVRVGRKANDMLNNIKKVIYIFEKESRDNIDYIDLRYNRVIVRRKQ